MHVQPLALLSRRFFSPFWITLYRAPKLMETTNDYLSELPSDILSMITDKLDLKDAVKTSILSKRWKYIWINHPDLIFNHLNVFGLDRKKLKKDSVGADSNFVKYVDQTMQQRLKGDDKITSFRVSFVLGEFFSQSIDRWISCVLRKGVETIDLDFLKLYPIYIPSSFKKCYNFPWLLTISEDKGTLKHLRVARCRLQLAPASCSMKFDSLISLQLIKVSINDLQLKEVLEYCPLLENLSLHFCTELTHIRNGDIRLKVLYLKQCSKIKEIDLCTDNLISLKLKLSYISNQELTKFLKSCPVLKDLTLYYCQKLTHLSIGNSSNNTSLMSISLKKCFKLEHIDLCADNVDRLEYTGKLISWSFMKTPRLTNAFLSYLNCVKGRLLTEDVKNLDSNISRLTLDFPMLQNLIFSQEDNCQYFMNPKPVTEFLNIRRLVLPVMPAHSEDILIWARYILKAFPLLQTLELNLDRPFDLSQPIKTKTGIEEEEEKVMKKCHNGSISEVKVNGFVGNQNEVDLVKYLLENLSGLKELTLSPYKKAYKRFDSWEYNDIQASIEFDLFEYECHELLKVIPPSVCLHIERQRI
ncbi:F-box/FBD/LRR-repeat protein At1g13570-like [Impatiens glandulifera]|uniref:F-box/FBD/LRR-repeat protein At1g13570-like n=1 Tax=Impatiens glandulifera TaxID=253017 RepID=UPI001FB14058|nr:F-box/FBD/LRR-repeat protein At1g13570-like [Impatiens glandulifera]